VIFVVWGSQTVTFRLLPELVLPEFDHYLTIHTFYLLFHVECKWKETDEAKNIIVTCNCEQKKAKEARKASEKEAEEESERKREMEEIELSVRRERKRSDW
jgi:hypothetical protein